MTVPEPSGKAALIEDTINNFHDVVLRSVLVKPPAAAQTKK